MKENHAYRNSSKTVTLEIINPDDIIKRDKYIPIGTEEIMFNKINNNSNYKNDQLLKETLEENKNLRKLNEQLMKRKENQEHLIEKINNNTSSVMEINSVLKNDYNRLTEEYNAILGIMDEMLVYNIKLQTCLDESTKQNLLQSEIISENSSEKNKIIEYYNEFILACENKLNALYTAFKFFGVTEEKKDKEERKESVDFSI